MAKILVVDDDDADRLSIGAMLEAEGHDVWYAEEGNEAVEMYLQHSIHVVVTDMVMPGGDGLGLISALKNMNPASAIIAVSGQSRSRLEASRIFGAETVLEKPVDRAELVAAVAGILDGRE
jgi:CheY-like chemotaxis protein